MERELENRPRGVRCPDCDTYSPRSAAACSVCGRLLSNVPDAPPTPPAEPPYAEKPTSGGPSGDALRVGTILGSGIQHAVRDHVDFSQSTFHAPVIGVQNNYGPASPGLTGPAAADGWPRFIDVRRLALGVRPTQSHGGEPTLPPYVPRDRDAELDRMLAHVLETGGLVVVTGEPLSGKTSTAWAALNRGVPEDTRLYRAHPGDDLRGLPAALHGRDPGGTYVVWLDDLEGHLGEQGLTAGLLAQLTHRGVVVLATMRDEAYDTHRFGDRPAARVLSVARTLELTCRWSEAELARLAEADDPLLVDAVRWRGDLGVTQFLAVGPELWEEWWRARRPSGRPHGHLLVRIAVELARCGVTAAVPVEAFEHQVLQSFTQADLEWAARHRLGVIGLLVPGGEAATWRASGPLVAAAMRAPDLRPAEPDVWRYAAEMAREYSPADFDAVVHAGRAAVRVWAEADDVSAVWSLADLAALAGDDADARLWYRRLVERDPRLGQHFGEYLLGQGEYTEAICYLARAAEAGSAGAVRVLGPVLLTQAEHWLAMAAANGSERAAVQLASLRKAFPTNPDTVKE